MFAELRQWNIPVAEVSQAKIDRLFRKRVAPYIREYQAKVREHMLNPELINKTWQGFWKVLGNINGFNYDVPRCNLTQKKIMELEGEHRAALLLPADIFIPSGLERLRKVLPFKLKQANGWNQEDKIFNKSKKGGCIDVEMQLTAPYTTNGGYNEYELKEKIESEGRFGQRLATYLVASKFSQLLTGHPFDEHNTYSRLIGSVYDRSYLAASSNPDGYVDVYLCPSSNKYSNLGGRSEGLIKKKFYFWERNQDFEVI